MDWQTIVVPLLVAVAGCGGFWTYIEKRQAKRDDERKKETEEDRAIRDAVKAMIRVEIIRESLRCIHYGSVSMEEADSLMELYEPYEKLGGNGNGKRLYEQAMALPRRTGREEER